MCSLIEIKTKNICALTKFNAKEKQSFKIKGHDTT